MSEMVERVARAIYAASPEGLGNRGDRGEPFCVNRPFWEVLARHAIEVMREPTEAMIDGVAATVFPRVSIGRGRYAGISDCWRVMIDAALVSERGAEE